MKKQMVKGCIVKAQVTFNDGCVKERTVYRDEKGVEYIKFDGTFFKVSDIKRMCGVKSIKTIF